MKAIIALTALTLLLSLHTFSQNRIHKGVLSGKPTSERPREIHKPYVDDLQGLNDIESFQLKSKSIYRQTGLINAQKEFYEVDGFNAKDTRTTINKTLIGNGFLLIEQIRQTWIGSWVNYAKLSYTYDEFNNLIEMLWQGYVYSAWANKWKFSYTYDENNNLIVMFRQSWDGSAWAEDLKSSYTYDGNNNLIEELALEWDGSAWRNRIKYAYTYNENNNLIEMLRQGWVDSTWVHSWKFSYIYDEINNLIEMLVQDWDGSVWVDSRKSSYTYDGNNNLIEELVHGWNGFAWLHSWKFSYIYDENNNLIELLEQGWDGSVWWDNWKSSYTYDGSNNMTEKLELRCDSYGWDYVYKYIYSYLPTGIEQFEGEVDTYSLSNNYPNPFNSSTRITYSISERSNVSLKVFDLLGSEVVELVNGEIEAGTYDIIFNASNLPSGVYFYRLKTENFFETKKMIYLK